MGVTLTETLLVIALIAILAVLASTYYQAFLVSNQLDNAASDVLDTLRRAQANSMNKESNTTWGVHFETNKFVLFSGASYNAVDPNNEINNLPVTVTITTITLTGGGSDAIFNKVKGTTANSGSITLQNTINETATISISAVGKIERL